MRVSGLALVAMVMCSVASAAEHIADMSGVPARLKRYGWTMELPFESSLIEFRKAEDRAHVHSPGLLLVPELRMENAAVIRTEKDYGNIELMLAWTWAAHGKETDLLEVRLRETENQYILVQLHPDSGTCVISLKEGETTTKLNSDVIAYRDGSRNKLDPDHWTTIGIRDMNGTISVFICPSDNNPDQAENGYNPRRPVVQAKYDKTKFMKGKVAITNRQVGRPEIVAGVRVETFVRDINLVTRK